MKLFELESACIELIVDAFFGDELFVVAALDYSAVVKNHDNIGIHDGGESVRDDKYSSASMSLSMPR